MFYVVHIKYRGQHRGWEIWYSCGGSCDCQKPFIELEDGLELSRMEARALVKDWNTP